VDTVEPVQDLVGHGFLFGRGGHGHIGGFGGGDLPAGAFLGALLADRLLFRLAFGARIGVDLRLGIRIGLGLGFGVRLGLGFRRRLRLGLGIRIGLRLGLGIRIGLGFCLDFRLGLCCGVDLGGFGAGLGGGRRYGGRLGRGGGCSSVCDRSSAASG
jgi:hypothetical protein